MIEAPWRGGREEGAFARLVFAPLGALAFAYALGARAQRALQSTRAARASAAPFRVVAIGSAVAGGAGKTPLAAFVAAGLRARGVRVAVASRGHGRRMRPLASRREPIVVSDGERIAGDVERCGDEPLWLAGVLPGVPVVVARDRARAGALAHALFATEVLVLDDGLQHHRIAHDVEIAVFDAHAGLGNARVLPRGPLREPLEALRSVDAIVLVGGALPARDEALVREAAPRATRFEARREIVGVRSLGLRGEIDRAVLRGFEVGALSGIGSPASFRATLEGAGARIVAERRFPDHHRFRERDLRGLAASARIWVTTEKDALKLRADWARAAGIDVRVAASRIRIEPESPFFDWLGRALERGR